MKNFKSLSTAVVALITTLLTIGCTGNAGRLRGRSSSTDEVLLFSVLGNETKWETLNGLECIHDILDGRLIGQASGLNLGHRYTRRVEFDDEGNRRLLGWNHKGGGTPLTSNSPCASVIPPFTASDAVDALNDAGANIPPRLSRSPWTWQAVITAVRLGCEVVASRHLPMPTYECEQQKHAICTQVGILHRSVRTGTGGAGHHAGEQEAFELCIGL
jgi:hypothetical protein